MRFIKNPYQGKLAHSRGDSQYIWLYTQEELAKYEKLFPQHSIAGKLFLETTGIIFLILDTRIKLLLESPYKNHKSRPLFIKILAKNEVGFVKESNLKILWNMTNGEKNK